ncbi:MAG: hypothetical protein KF721_05910 [Ignavibacteriaceae bacterium]|nr:hypothetical protein [Ignavibacteriaceae bacterium]
MKAIFTTGLFYSTLMLILITVTTSCSASIGDEKKESIKILKFKTEINEKNSLIEVTLRNNNIDKLLIDGEEIPSEEYYKYKDLIDSKSNLSGDDTADKGEKRIKIVRMDSDSDSTEDGIEKEIVIINKNKVERDREKLEARIRKFTESIGDLSDSTKRKRIKVIVKDIDSLIADLDTNIFKFEFDMQNLNKHFKAFPHMFEDFEFDVPGFHYEGFQDLNKKLDKLEKDIQKREKALDKKKSELKKTKEFISKFKNELYKDKLISSTNEEPKVEFYSDELTVNGKSVTKQQFEKYKKMYEEIIGKEEERKLLFKMK